MSVERARGLLVDLLYKEHLGTRSGDMIAEALRELQPEPRIIDWQKVVDNQLPVRVGSAKSPNKGYLAFLAGYDGEGTLFPFNAVGDRGDVASLETGQWVFNSSGENVWPEGVLVEVWFNSRPKQLSGFWRADECLWGFSGGLSDHIIASRAVGLEEGWSYGGGE